MADVDMRTRMREKDKVIQALRLKTEALKKQNAQLVQILPKGGDVRQSCTGPVTLESIYNWIDEKVQSADAAQEERKTVGHSTDRAQRQKEWVRKRNRRPQTVVEPFSFQSYLVKNEVAPRVSNQDSLRASGQGSLRLSGQGSLRLSGQGSLRLSGQGSLRLSHRVENQSQTKRTVPPRPRSASQDHLYRPQRSHSARAARSTCSPTTSKDMDARNATRNSAPEQNRSLIRQSSARASARRSTSQTKRQNDGNRSVSPVRAVESTNPRESRAVDSTMQSGNTARISQGVPRAFPAQNSYEGADRRSTGTRSNHSRRTAQKKPPLASEPLERFKETESGYAPARASAPQDIGSARKKSKTSTNVGPMQHSPFEQYNLIRRSLITLNPSKTMAQLSDGLRVSGCEQTHPDMDVRQGGQPHRVKLAWNSEEISFEAVKTCAGHGSKCVLLPPIMERHTWIVPPERIQHMAPGNYTLSDPFTLSTCDNLQLALYFYGTHFGVMLRRDPLRVPPFRFLLTVGSATSNVMAPTAQFIGPFGRVGDIWVAGSKKAFRMDEVEFPLRIMVDVLMTYAQQSAFARAHPPAHLHTRPQTRTTDWSTANRDTLPLSAVPTQAIVPIDTAPKTAVQQPIGVPIPHHATVHSVLKEIPGSQSSNDTAAQAPKTPSPPPTPIESGSKEIPEHPPQSEMPVDERAESPRSATVAPEPEAVKSPAAATSSTSSAVVGRMWVRIISATDLRAADLISESDPYVVVKMRADATGLMARKRTHVRKKVRHVIWNEILDDFDIRLEAVGDKETIDLEVVDSDMISRGDPIGTASVPFPTVSGERHLVCTQLWEPNGHVGHAPAVLLLEYCFLNADSDIRTTTAPTTITRIPPDVQLPRIGHVIVTCKSAVALRSADHSLLSKNDSADPYCDVSVAGAFGNKSLRTKVIHKDLNPVWNEALQFHVTQMDPEVSKQQKQGWGIKMEVIDSDFGLNPDGFLGLLELPDVYADMCAQFDKPLPEAQHYTLTHVALQDRQDAKSKIATGHVDLEVVFVPLSLPQYMRLEHDPKTDKAVYVVDVEKVHAAHAARSNDSRALIEMET